jgi:4-alpha-glucanotransferase
MQPSHARRAGVCMHISSLPGPYGVGTIGRHARWFVDQMVRMGLSVWQVLPTGPTGYGDSPYQLLSVFAGNPILIDLPTLCQQGLLEPGELQRVPMSALDEAEFGNIINEKNALLAIAAQRFTARASSGRQSALAAFRAQHDELWLDDFAHYSVIKATQNEQPWHEWPTSLADADPDALGALNAAHADAIEKEKIIQFLFFEQWQALHDYASQAGIELIGDVPIYVALDSADTWSRRRLFQLDERGRPTAVGGVPPDYFSADGQLWGNPLYAWDEHARDGFAWWIERMKHACALTDLVRIDHFRGFEAYWSIPADAATARDGHWVSAPGYALFDALRDAIDPLPVIAEDLGVITEPVTALRRHYGLPGMAVLQFLLDEPHFHPDHVEEDRVCYTGTHDNDTTVSWFDGSGERSDADTAHLQRHVLELTGGDRDSVHIDLIRMALNTRARYAIAPMQDFLGLPTQARFNTPGTTDGNWRWRLRHEHISDDLCDRFYTLVRDSERVLPK